MSRYLKNCYHTDLTKFSKDELFQQRFDLQKMSDALVGTKEKNKRRLLRNQILNIQNMVDEILFNERSKLVGT